MLYVGRWSYSIIVLGYQIETRLEFSPFVGKVNRFGGRIRILPELCRKQR